MLMMPLTENSNLLTYAIETSPEPLAVSPPTGNPSVASLTIVVSNSQDFPIYCNKIVFHFDIGDLAQNLTATAQGILVAANPSDRWQISAGGDGTFTATPKKPEFDKITTDGLVFQIYNIRVSQKVGTFAFTIGESSCRDNQSFKLNENQYMIAKFPYGFYMSNFTAAVPQVPDKGSTKLTWTGSDLAIYTLLYDDKKTDVTLVRSWNTPPLSHDTNFILKATCQSEGETVNHYLNTMVTVANPDLMATNLTVKEATSLNGNTVVGTDGAAANLTVKGGLTVGGTLLAQGNANLGSAGIRHLEVSSDMAVSGKSTVADLRVNGALQMGGPMDVMGSGHAINPGTYYPSTDGFAIGYISWTQGADPTKKCIGGVWGSTNGYSVWAIGGHLRYYENWYAGNGQSFTLPVQKGVSFGIGTWIPNDNQINPSYSFWWVPMGTGGVSKHATLERIDDEVAPPMPAHLEAAEARQGSAVLEPVGAGRSD